MRNNQFLITLHPADSEKIKDYCKRTDLKFASVLRDVIHQVVHGVLLRKESKRNYFDLS